jgi:branched-chain amino acid transport system substrate-binding protein
MKRLLVLLILAAASVVTFASAQDTIKIGNAYNQTGGMSSLDVPASNGAMLAVKEINAAGGVLGKQLELVSYDGKTDPATITNIT